MSRQTRQFSKTGMYHVLFRGVNHCNIFEEDEDYELFLRRLQITKDKIAFKLYAYCLMSNHVHLVIHEQETGDIVSIMRTLLTPYAFWFNKKYQRIGSLIADRYKSECINNDAYLLTLLKYIHKNPVKAKLVAQISDYKWSSYNEYVNFVNKTVDADFVYSVFSDDKHSAIKKFIEYHSITGDDITPALEKERLNDNDVRLIIMKQLEGKEPNELVRYNKTDRDAVLRKLKASGLSIRQIERATGISRGVIAKS